MKELLSATLFVKLNICRAHGKRQLYDRMIDSPVFNRYCDFKFKGTGLDLDRLESLIARVQSTFFR